MKKLPCPGRRASSFLSLFLLLLDVPSLAFAALPKVDFNRMGHVGLAGTFAGLDLFDSAFSVSFDPSSSTLLFRSSDGSLTRLASTNSGGRINAGCALGDRFYFGGSFSSVNGTSASNVASYSPSDGSFNVLGDGGPNGEVNAFFCDSSNGRVWVGGSFSSPGQAVAVWDTSSNIWSPPPFGGLSGALGEVLSITTNSSSSSLFFAGSFITSFGSNITINGTNNPNVPFSPGATPFSSSLVPIPLQDSEIDASPSSSDPDFSDITNILCPSGSDGPGQTWLADDGFKAVINVRKFTQLDAFGVRLGNTFLDDRGTTTFCLTSIPDNIVQTLTYFDPTTGTNQTCRDECPLLRDPSIPYQDYLFPSDVSLTGFQLTLLDWTGSGAGLHLIQLLSSGAFASAVESRNGQSCFAPNPSNTTRVGTWTEKTVTTDIAGTVQDILAATVAMGTPSSDAPSFTWMAYVSASGIYNVNMLIPGCVNFQDCDARTSVKVTVFPGGGLDPTVVRVSQRNTEDVSELIYSGPIFPSTSTFVTTVTMELDDDPEGTGQDGNYELVADRIELQLLSPDGNFTVGTGSGGNATSTRQGFGFFEWPLQASGGVNASGVLPNATETSLDAIGFQMLSEIGGSTSVAIRRTVIAAVAHHPSGTVFLGGNFSISSASNVVAFRDGALAEMANGGLNGPVSSLVVVGNTLFVGGAFTDTSSPSTGGGANGVVAYNINSNSWSPLGSGLDGAVTSLDFLNGQVAITGNFTDTPGATSGSSSGGFAVWNTNNSTWGNGGGFLIGSMSFVGNGTAPARGQELGQFLAGNVISSRKFGATGFVLLKNGEDDIPTIASLSVRLQDNSQAASPSARRKRSSKSTSTWLLNFRLPSLFARQSPSPTPLPSPPPAPAPAVLSGDFWTNSSSSQDTAILGGNFSFPSSAGQSSNVALYNLETGTISGLTGNPINGTVRAVLVVGDKLYLGGEFTVSGSEGIGFAIYDLQQQQLDVSGLQPLQGSTGVVRSLTNSDSRPTTVIVAGSFTSAGGTACAGICQLDTNTKQWSSLGSGFNGEVASVAYGGDDQDLLFASGSIVLLDGTPANVAMFSFSNSTWTAVGRASDIPGPVTAVTVDDGNSSSIFAAGRSSDGTQSFLSFWNGVTWTSLDSGFDGSSNISQLALVPLQDTHGANGFIEQDRMLMLSGSLVSPSFGNASTVLYDGQSFIPYIASSTSSGGPGFVSSVFTSISNFSFAQRRFLATGVVILIAIAIAAGVVFLMVLLGILWTLFARREQSDKAEYAMYDDDDDSTHHNPTSLLEHVNAATVSMLGGATSPFDDQKGKAEEAGRSPDPFASHDGDHYARSEVPDAAVGMGFGGDEQGRLAHARYSFDGDREGELPLHEGMALEILDDNDTQWWYARNLDTGKEGVVPAAYVI